MRNTGLKHSGEPVVFILKWGSLNLSRFPVLTIVLITELALEFFTPRIARKVAGREVCRSAHQGGVQRPEVIFVLTHVTARTIFFLKVWPVACFLKSNGRSDGDTHAFLVASRFGSDDDGAVGCARSVQRSSGRAF